MAENNSPTAPVAGPNPDQLDAINFTQGPLLIIAGPGSGKTFTLVERVIHLIKTKNLAPEAFLVVTFTDKAARELATRLSNRLISIQSDFNINEMLLGTFHSVCLKILEDHREFTRLKRSFAVLDQFDQQYFLYQRLGDYRALENAQLVMGEPELGRWAQSEMLLKWLNKVREEALDVDAMSTASDASVAALARCFHLYEKHLDEANYLDFSGIQYETLKLLTEQPQVAAKLRSQLQYLMVDEYQDTNTIQERILLLLLGDNQNICVVGDDDQGLYRFRGATIRNILEFPNLFKGGCKTIKLTINYRSHPNILTLYNKWMGNLDWTGDGVSFRYAKEIVAQNKTFPDAPAVLRIQGSEGENLNAEVLNFLKRLEGSGQLKDWNQVAFLFRSVRNTKVISLGEYLEEHGIPVYSPRSNMYFKRDEIRLVIGALIFLFPQFPIVRELSTGRRLEVWDYYDNSCFTLFVSELRKPENKTLLDWARPLAKQHLHLSRTTDYAFTGLLYRLLRFPLFNRYLADEALNAIDKGRAARNIATFSKLLAKFEYLHFVSVLNPEFLEKDIRNLFNNFLRFLIDGGIDEYEDESEYAPSGCVSFLTIHQSKGLEYPIVLVGSLEAVPRKQYTDLDELLESGGYLSKASFEPFERMKHFDFRRLYYTAFSRAQDLLILLAEGSSRSPSKYFRDDFSGLTSWHAPEFTPEKLTFASVKTVDLKREYSFTSHITVFENCAEQYRFFNELEFNPVRASPMLFGQLVHQTIEDIHKAVLRGEESKLSSDQIETWFSGNYASLTKKERVYLNSLAKDAALGQVLRYYERERGRWDRIAEAEVEISLVKEKYILKGSVDLIRGEGDTVEIVDFKSEKKPDLEKDKDRLRQYQRQLEVYAHLVERRTGRAVSRMHLYYTSEESGNPYISFQKDSRLIEKTIGVFDDVVARIEAKDYAITERPVRLCENCDMRFYCDTKNWNFRKATT